MYTIWTRANSLFFTSLSVLAILCACTTLSTYLHVPNPIVHKLALNKIHSLRNYRDNTDRATLSFDLNADLTSVFNWNTKQLFVYIIAEYKTQRNERNQVVIWDKIIPNKDAAHLQYTAENLKYFLADQYNELRGTNVTLRLEWDIMPVCGRLFIQSAGKSSFLMPKQYEGKAARRP